MCTQAFQKNVTQGGGRMIETCETAELQKGRGDWYLVWGEQIRGGEGEDRYGKSRLPCLQIRVSRVKKKMFLGVTLFPIQMTLLMKVSFLNLNFLCKFKFPL